MKCPLCPREVEASVGQVPGVKRVEADLPTGKVKILAQEGRSPDLKEIRARIGKWGFRVAPEPLVIRAEGTLTHGPRARLMFRVPGLKEDFDLLEGEELRRLLISLPATGNRRVELTARVHTHPENLPPSLSILSYEVKTP